MSLVPAELLKKSDKILFLAHFAIGDFTYFQPYFKAFSEAYPHLKIHLWIDDVRRTSNESKWKWLKNYSLYDWAEALPYFSKVYRRTYSPALLKESIEEARKENYPIVISLGTLRPLMYTNMARKISPKGFIVGMKKSIRIAEWHRLPFYRKPDASLPVHVTDRDSSHVSSVYAGWFKKLFGFDVPKAQRFPSVNIPEQWRAYAKQQIAQWQVDKQSRQLIFINPYAKTHKRSWPLERVSELIQEMQKSEKWRDAFFIVNAMPVELDNVKKMIADHGLTKVVPFSATENFFQLPAVMEQCDLIISVETSVMHLANAVHVPVVALMRNKNPEWVPMDEANSVVIMAAKRRHWVRRILVSAVMERLKNTS